MRAIGIDVSEFQGKIDWKAVAGAGVTFAYCRATIGMLGRDEKFFQNAKGAREAGLLVGAYHAFSPTQDPISQAANFCNVAGPCGAFELPPVLDLELPNPDGWEATRFDAVALQERALGWMQNVSSRFCVDALVYTGSYFSKKLPSCVARAELGRFGLWLAEYNGKDSQSAVPSFGGDWPGWLFWQFSGDASAKVPGIVGHVDHDVYNGTIEDLRAAFPKTDFS